MKNKTMVSTQNHFWIPEKSDLFITMSHLYQEQAELHRRAKAQFLQTNKVLLTTMLLFFLVTMLVLFLYIYVRCIIRRQVLRRAAILQLTTGIVSVVHAHQPMETHGLDPVVIARLPILLYKRNVVDQPIDEKTTAEECSVCLSFLEEEEIVRVLPNCNHTFHAKCIDMWLMANPTCPICRTEAQPRVLEESSKSEHVQSMV